MDGDMDGGGIVWEVAGTATVLGRLPTLTLVVWDVLTAILLLFLFPFCCVGVGLKRFGDEKLGGDGAKTLNVFPCDSRAGVDMMKKFLELRLCDVGSR